MYPPRNPKQAKMQPFNNSFPPRPPNQAQPGKHPLNPHPQGFAANHTGFRPQMGMVNPQFPGPGPGPFNNYNHPNPHLSGQPAMNLINMLAQQQQPGLMNSNVAPFGFNPAMGVGFPPQNFVGNVGLANPFQGQGQAGVFAPNFASLPQGQFNPSMAFPNMTNQMQNFGSVLPQGQFNPSVGPFGMQSNWNQHVDPQALNLLQNVLIASGQQFNQHQQSTGMAAIGANVPVSLPMLNQPGQVNWPAPHQAQNSQNKFSREGHGSVKNAKGKPFLRNNLKREWKKGSQLGRHRPQFQEKENRKRKRKVKEDPEEDEKAVERRRALISLYTEKEIKKWRYDRKKNFPSKANLQKKMKKLSQPQVLQREAKLRRKQLKQILAKQAELGVEVAELPPEYICDSEEQNRKGSTGKGILKKHDRKGRKKGDNSANEQQLGNEGSSDVTASSKQEPTLLKKLLNADVRRDKRRLLQVLRFMVSNSFFKYWPDAPLKYPLVQVADNDDYESVDEESSPCGVSAVDPEKKVDISLHKDKNQEDGHNMDHSDDEENNNDVEDEFISTSDDDDKYAAVPGIDMEQQSLTVNRKGKRVEVASNTVDAEEGEIIDC